MNMHEVRVENTPMVRLPELIESVISGDEIVFTQNEKPVARLTAISVNKPQPQFRSGKDLFDMADNFDEPLERKTSMAEEKSLPKARIIEDPVTGLPVIDVGDDAPILTNEMVREMLADFP
jgi:antitoxin (DNA-binding transcriptional repressor) of toxin-antitoxin stability system